MDTAAVLAAASDDPDGFVAGLPRPTVIDEVQRAPPLALAIKAAVDADRRAGQFLLTGSAAVMSLPRLAESLAGRMELHTLWPLSQGEIDGTRETFIDRLFAAELATPRGAENTENEVIDRICAGGYPEARTRRAGRRRGAWFDAYIVMEVTKQLGWCERRCRLFHFRIGGGAEVDLVIENRAGQLVGVEVKCTATLRPRDFVGLKALAEIAGDRFVRGVVVYLGAEVVPFGQALHGLPIAQVWT